MVLSNDHMTKTGHAHLSNTDTITRVAPDRDDRVVAVRSRPPAVAPHLLGADHRAMLHTLVAHVLPVDDGATHQAEIVVRHIDRLVANEPARLDHSLSLADLYGSGCELIQAHACRVYGRRVQAMSAVEQDRLVWDMLESSMDGFDRFSPAFFFHTLRRHIADAIEGGAISPN